jgi:glycosyltransferase involved in cell wall biosynthesis
VKTRIAYLTFENPLDKKSWSGIHYNMLESLEREGFEVNCLGPVESSFLKLLRGISFLSKTILRKKILFRHTLISSRIYGRIFRKKIDDYNPDLIFAANASTEIAFLGDLKIPIIYLSGGTVKLLEGYYESFSNVFLFSSRNANKVEQAAIDKASALVYPTYWAANSAKNDYGASEEKVHVIPYGANVDFESSEPKNLDLEKVRMLLVGVRWEGKGAPIAIEAVQELRKRGYNVTIDICGCQPPEPIHEEGINIHGFLDKRDGNQAKKLKELYTNATFFILPTRYENFGVSFVEALAAGLPCLGTNTGGVPTIIEPGENGYLFELSDRGEVYADKVMEMLNNPGHYTELSKNARISFEQRFNWKVWGSEIKKVIQKVVDQKEA